MTVYVMGAGASLHAKYPLGRNLLRALADWLDKGIHQSNALKQTEIPLILRRYQEPLSTVRELFGELDDCEEILRELDSRAKQANTAHLRDALAGGIREFFADIASQEGAETYDLFAQTHAKRGDVIITFNYDIALERALKKAGRWDIKHGYGFPFGFFPDAQSDVKVLKLHGSVNWFQRPTQEDMPPLIARRDLDLLGYPPNLTDPRIGKDGFSSDNTGTLILPDPNKEYYWKELWRKIWDSAEKSLASTPRLVMLGYSLPKSDSEPRELLLEKTNHDASIEICCKSDSDSIASVFRGCGFSNVTPRSDATFQRWVSESVKG